MAALGLAAFVIGSPALGMSCMLSMPGKSHTGPLPAVTAAQSDLATRLEAHVRDLAQGPRADAEGLRRARSTIRRALPDVDFDAQVFDEAHPEWVNLEVVAPGSPETVVVVAHYDTVSTTPGADDNASGVAALIEIVRQLAPSSHERTIRFAFVCNEEPPHFAQPTMGSKHYAEALADDGVDVVAMLSLETVGYYRDTPDSQHYPFPFSLFFPSTGNFIGFVGNVRSRALTRSAVGSFREHADFPSEGVVAPVWIQGVDWSDQRSFWDLGYPGVMVTDTAPNRNANYHLSSDTPDTLDYERMARVVEGLAAVVGDLAN